MIILNGQIAAQNQIEALKTRIKHLGFKPKLTIIQVGNNPASNKYISYKLKQAKVLTIQTKLIKLPSKIQELELIKLIKLASKSTDGLIVQLPLPNHLNQTTVLNSVPFIQDIDGLNSDNNLIKPATPLAIINLLNAYNFDVKNQTIAVIGQSNLVGKPMALLCEELGAKKVYRLDQTTGIATAKKADIVIVAIGKPKFIQAKDLKNNSIVVDVGINEIADTNAMKKIVGDVDFEAVKTKVKALSPVPYGVGPMTITALFSNLVSVCESKKQ